MATYDKYSWGTGVAARLAAEQVAPTGTVVGVDPHPGILEVARGTSSDVEWRQGRAEDLPPDQVRSMLDVAGFGDVEVETGSLPLRVPPPADFFWQYVRAPRWPASPPRSATTAERLWNETW